MSDLFTKTETDLFKALEKIRDLERQLAYHKSSAKQWEEMCWDARREAFNNRRALQNIKAVLDTLPT